VTETLFGSLKFERLHGEHFLTTRAAKDAVLNWLFCYNGQRMYSTLNYVSPAKYEQNWQHSQQGRGTEGEMERVEKPIKPSLPPFPQILKIACGDPHIFTIAHYRGNISLQTSSVIRHVP